MSRSLHSAIEYFGGSNRWSRNESDIEPWKSSIGEISSKISSRPDCFGISPRSGRSFLPTRARHASFPSSQSKLSIWRARRLGTSCGSRILAKEIRAGAVDFCFAAKFRPSKVTSLLIYSDFSHSKRKASAAICLTLGFCARGQDSRGDTPVSNPGQNEEAPGIRGLHTWDLLLDADLCAGCFESCLRLICGRLISLLEESCWSRVNEILCFLQAE
jgi:hypothetical protein